MMMMMMMMMMMDDGRFLQNKQAHPICFVSRLGRQTNIRGGMVKLVDMVQAAEQLLHRLVFACGLNVC